MHHDPLLVSGRLAALALAAAVVLGACSSDSTPSLISSGKEFLAKKEPRKAVIQFKSALQKDPQSAEARFLLGQALLDAGDPFGAEVELARALDLRYDDAKVMPQLARAMLLSGGAKKLSTLYGDLTLTDKTANASLKSWVANAWGVLGDQKKAMAANEAALASVPDFPAALILQARFTAMDGKFDAALATVEQVLKRDGNNAEAWHLKGEILANAKNDAKGAEDAFNRALAAEPAFVAAHLALIGLDLKASNIAAAKAQADKLRAVLPKHPQTLFVDARMALYERNLPKARELTQQLLRIAPDNVGVLQLAGTVEALSGSLVQGEADFAKALQLNPNLPLARRGLARTYLDMGQPTKALKTLEPMTATDTNADAEALSLAGNARLQLGDAPSAEALYLRAAKLAPTDAKLRTALALMTLSHGDAEKAFSQLDAISASTSDSATDMAIVSARLKRKEYDAALQALDKLAKKQPNSATVPELRGIVFSARKDYAAARTAFEGALALEPSRFSVVSNLAALDVMEGKPDQARQRLDAAIAKDPRNHLARMALADLQVQRGAPLADVRATLSEGIKVAPSEPGPRLRLIELLLQKKQFKDALAVAQEAVAALPNDADILDAMGRAQIMAGDTQQAISTFRRLAGQDTHSARPQLRLAELMKATGNREGAISALRQALELEPGSEAAQAGLMDMLVTNGRPKEALEMALSMQQHTPTLATGYLLEGAIHRRVKNVDAAIEAYRRGVDRSTAKTDLAIALHNAMLSKTPNGPSPDADRFAASWLKAHPDDLAFEYHVATVDIFSNDLDAAETHLNRVLAARPNYPMALNNLAWVLAKRGKPGAVAYAQKAVDLLPNRPTLMDTLAMALAADKQLPKALEMQRKAIDIAPGDMGLRLNLARIAIQAGDKTLARTELDRLAALGDKLPYQAEVARLLKTL